MVENSPVDFFCVLLRNSFGSPIGHFNGKPLVYRLNTNGMFKHSFFLHSDEVNICPISRNFTVVSCGHCSNVAATNPYNCSHMIS